MSNNKKPNILILMTDQMNGTLFPDGPSDFLHLPTLSALAARSARFSSAYCASPLCAPSRASFMSGLLPYHTGVYDNAAEFPSSLPCFTHALRTAGYRTVLSGKMHFVGPDQLHGFEERMTTDVYPADFGWTPDWRKPNERINWWYHNLGSVTGAGVADISNQMEYDDEVAHFAVQRLYDFARRDEEPFCLTVSFTHPHDPYVMRRQFWDLYTKTPMPTAPQPAQDPHSLRLQAANDAPNFDIREEHILRSRRAYFAACSYIDEKIANIMKVLDACGFADNTIILFCADHGDMLGERGLWFKMSFYEGSARIPLMICAPDVSPQTVRAPVSLLDVAPTLSAMVGADMPAGDGRSLMPLLAGDKDAEKEVVFAEYVAEGSIAPMVMARQGDYKYVECPADPPQLFNLANDASEENNLADSEKDTAKRFADIVAKQRDMAAFDKNVRTSQQRRLSVYPALRNGRYYPWDFQPLQKASERYMRNHMDLNVLEHNARFPRDLVE